MKQILIIFLFVVTMGTLIAQSSFSELLKTTPKDETYQNVGKPNVKLAFPLSPRAVKVVRSTMKYTIISWRPPFISRDVKAYKIYRDFKKIAEVSADAREFFDRNVIPGKSYFYMVRTVNFAGKESGVVGVFAYDGYQSGHGLKHWERILKMPFVAGITVSFFWKDCEPQKGKFRWQHIDNLIKLAAKYNKTVGLWPYMPAPWCPDWLKDKVKKYDMDKRRCKSNIPYALDPIIIKEWKRFITAMGKRYNKNPHVDYVLVTLSGTSGMHNNVQPGPRQFELLSKKFGYKVKDHIAAWKDMFKVYAKVFPDKPWGYGIQFTNDEVGPSLEVASWALNKYGSQVRLLNEGLNGNDWYRVQHKLNGWKLNNEFIADQSWRTMCGYQMLGRSWSSKGLDKGGNGAMKVALDNGINYGATWLEIWTLDINQKPYHALYENADARMGLVKAVIPTEKQPAADVMVETATMSPKQLKRGESVKFLIKLKIFKTISQKSKFFIHFIKPGTNKISYAVNIFPKELVKGNSYNLIKEKKISLKLSPGKYFIYYGISVGHRIPLAGNDGKLLKGNNLTYLLGELIVK
jgi:Beta-galactosidase